MGLHAAGKIVPLPETVAKTPTETAYYLLSKTLCPHASTKLPASTGALENRLHWRLDVVMNEDQDRPRLGKGPNNIAALRRMALNVMQKDGIR
jgi:predicted transposase YbfD/YdcC